MELDLDFHLQRIAALRESPPPAQRHAGVGQTEPQPTTTPTPTPTQRAGNFLESRLLAQTLSTRVSPSASSHLSFSPPRRPHAAIVQPQKTPRSIPATMTPQTPQGGSGDRPSSPASSWRDSAADTPSRVGFGQPRAASLRDSRVSRMNSFPPNLVCAMDPEPS